MRILLVTDWGLTNMGGIWTYMKQLSEKLSEQGHSVTLMGSHAESNTLYLLDQDIYFDKKAYYNRCCPISIPTSSLICIWSMVSSASSWGVMCSRGSGCAWAGESMM